MNLRKKLLTFLWTKPSSAKWLTEVECLANHYSQGDNLVPYIDTGIINSWDDELVITATISKIADGRRAVICGNYSGRLTVNLEVAGGNATRLYCMADTNVDPLHTLVDKYGPIVPENKPSKVWLKCTPLGDTDHTINYEIGVEALDGSFSSTSTGSFYRYGSPASNRQLRLFYDYRGGASSVFDGGFNMYQIEIKNGTNHKKFVPCLDLNRIPALYDVIGKQLYYNAGTGDFSVGRRITEVEYMNLTGWQRRAVRRSNGSSAHLSDAIHGISMRIPCKNGGVRHGTGPQFSFQLLVGDPRRDPGRLPAGQAGTALQHCAA